MAVFTFHAHARGRGDATDRDSFEARLSYAFEWRDFLEMSLTKWRPWRKYPDYHMYTDTRPRSGSSRFARGQLEADSESAYLCLCFRVSTRRAELDRRSCFD